MHDGNVIVTNQNNVDSAMTAFDAASGDQVWKIELPKKGNYSTPVVADVGGREQLLISGQKSVEFLRPRQRREAVDSRGKWDITCGTMVWDDELVFASGGYPAQQTLAIKADGSGEMVWENPIKVYEQSMLAAGRIHLCPQRQWRDLLLAGERWPGDVETTFQLASIAGQCLSGLCQRPYLFHGGKRPDAGHQSQSGKSGRSCAKQTWRRDFRLDGDLRQPDLYPCCDRRFRR